MPYGPHTDADRAKMLATIGVDSVDDLFADIPEDVRAHGIDLPDGEPEQILKPAMERLAAKNRVDLVSFLGAGMESHHIPTVVDQMLLRGEFLTAYTPYQPEVSQGTLQTIFEYQSLVGALLDMPVVSASHYDGSSAAAEAVLMMLRATRRDRVLVSAGIHPHFIDVMRTYLNDRFTLEVVPLAADGRTDLAALEVAFATGAPAAGVVCAQPNFFGVIEDMHAVSAVTHEAGALLTAIPHPISLSVLAPPGEYEADIAAADGQMLGIPLQFGGPSVGLLAATEPLTRQIPGRLVGRTADADGRPCYVMTMRAREQDIRREKAASNICTNQALCALAATVFMATVGPKGLRDMALQGADRARELETTLGAMGVLRTHAGPYLSEFAVSVPDAAAIHRGLIEQGYLAGLHLGAVLGEAFDDQLLLCTTELTTSDDIAGFAVALEDAMNSRARREQTVSP